MSRTMHITVDLLVNDSVDVEGLREYLHRHLVHGIEQRKTLEIRDESNVIRRGDSVTHVEEDWGPVYPVVKHIITMEGDQSYATFSGGGSWRLNRLRKVK